MTEKTPDNEATKEPKRVEYVERVDVNEDEIDLREYWAILRLNLKRSSAIRWSSASHRCCSCSQCRTGTFPRRSSPLSVDDKQGSSLGALASFGFSVGEPTKVQDLEALFKSKDLAVRVFQGHDLWPLVFPDSYDSKTGKMKVGWLSSFLDNDAVPKPPGEWHAIRAAKGGLKVSLDKKSGILSVSFESVSKEGSAKIVLAFLEEAKNRLQEEAFERASKNKKFIEGQISKTIDPLTRDRLYGLLGQEVEREMMAQNREQFGFRVIDSPRVPDRKSRPARGRNAIGVTLISGMAIWMYFIRVGRRRHLGEKASVL